MSICSCVKWDSLIGISTVVGWAQEFYLDAKRGCAEHNYETFLASKRLTVMSAGIRVQDADASRMGAAGFSQEDTDRGAAIGGTADRPGG